MEKIIRKTTFMNEEEPKLRFELKSDQLYQRNGFFQMFYITTKCRISIGNRIILETILVIESHAPVSWLIECL